MTKIILYWNPFTLLELTIVIHVLKYCRVIKHEIQYSGSFCAKPGRKTGGTWPGLTPNTLSCSWQFSCTGEYKAVLDWTILWPFHTQFEPVQVILTAKKQPGRAGWSRGTVPQRSLLLRRVVFSWLCYHPPQAGESTARINKDEVSLSAGNGTAMKSTPREGRHPWKYILNCTSCS